MAVQLVARRSAAEAAVCNTRFQCGCQTCAASARHALTPSETHCAANLLRSGLTAQLNGQLVARPTVQRTPQLLRKQRHMRQLLKSSKQMPNACLASQRPQIVQLRYQHWPAPFDTANIGGSNTKAAFRSLAIRPCTHAVLKLEVAELSLIRGQEEAVLFRV